MSTKQMITYHCPACGQKISVSVGFKAMYCSVGNGTSVSFAAADSRVHHAQMLPLTEDGEQ